MSLQFPVGSWQRSARQRGAEPADDCLLTTAYCQLPTASSPLRRPTCDGSCRFVTVRDGSCRQGLAPGVWRTQKDFMKAILHSGLAGMVPAELRCWHTLLWG
jgi:hypothetical protein